MGMTKDINDLIKEVKSVIDMLQKGYYKLGLDKRVSKISEKRSTIGSKFYGKFGNMCDWIRKEVRK